jgi:hypothetical protein
MSDKNIHNPKNSFQNSCKNTSDAPLIIFIIFCFFALIILFITKTYYTGPPSVLTSFCASYMSIISCFILILVGLLSVYIEWGFVFVFILGILFFMIGVLDPTSIEMQTKLV